MGLLALPWPWPWRIVAIGAVLGHGVWSLRGHVLHPAVEAAEWTADGRWRVRLRGAGRWEEARVAPDSFVTRHLSLLRFHTHRGRWVVLRILPDAVPEEVRRRLVLRWRAGVAADR